MIAIRDDRDTVTYADVVKAKQLKQHGLPDEHEYIERERHSVAVHEACHAVVAYRLRKHAVIDMATIERRGDVGGFVSSIPPEDQFVQWRSEREIDVMTALASLAGERMFFDGDHSMGVGGDMRAATGMTSQALAYYAMGDRFASRSVTLGADRLHADGDGRRPCPVRFGVRPERRRQARGSLRADVLAPRRQPVRGARARACPRDGQDDHGRRRAGHHRGHDRARPSTAGPTAIRRSCRCWSATTTPCFAPTRSTPVSRRGSRCRCRRLPSRSPSPLATGRQSVRSSGLDRRRLPRPDDA